MSSKLPENLLNAALELNIRGAKLNDAYQARNVHNILYLMLSEAEIDRPRWGLVGRYWLTDYAKAVLADMHDKLGQSPERGDALLTSVLDTVMLTPTQGNRRTLGDMRKELAIASAVVIELDDQSAKGNAISITKACKNVAESGEYNLRWGTIRNIYYRMRKGFDEKHLQDFVPNHFLRQILESGITDPFVAMRIMLL